MKKVAITYYRNKTSDRVVSILNKRKRADKSWMIRVQYIESKHVCWFFEQDFDRIFVKVP